MADFPLLPLPDAVVGVPPAGTGRPPPRPEFPTRQRQGERLGPTFQRLADVFERGRDPVTLRHDPAGLAPERVIVFEVAGSIGDFAAATKHIPGLEYLAEQDIDLQPDDDFWVEDTRKGTKGQPRWDKPVGGCLYMGMPDLQALRHLLSLWQRHQRGEDAVHNFGRWFKLFDQLREVRPWGPQDRISADVVGDFRQALADAPQETVTTEIELWAHASSRLRQAAQENVVGIVLQAGGSVLQRASIPQIAYEAVLADLPREGIARLIDHDNTTLALCDDVMFVRPQALPALHRPTGESSASRAAADPLPSPEAAPVAALLDGVPVQRHRLLDGRIVLDDPDGLENLSVVAERVHGTGMASLILHGDLDRREPSLSRRLHVHPVLYAPGHPFPERFHPRRLLIDTVYRAIRRMKEGEGETHPSAPHVFLVNLSLGDARRPYTGQISPWARLLDYLAHRYGVLFLVSAGNVLAPLPVPGHTSSTFEGRAAERTADRRPSRARTGAITADPPVTCGSHEHRHRGGLPRRGQRYGPGLGLAPAGSLRERCASQHQFRDGTWTPQNGETRHLDAGRQRESDSRPTRWTANGQARASRIRLRTRGCGARFWRKSGPCVTTRRYQCRDGSCDPFGPPSIRHSDGSRTTEPSWPMRTHGTTPLS